MKTAVLLVIFKRPDLTGRVMEVLARVKPPRLYIAADAPRPGRGEEELCAAARACAASVSWPCEVFTDFAAENLGSGRRVSSGITWFFNTEPEGIILEDDCLPDDTFFPYCEELLERYREDARVMVVSGYHGPAASAGEGTSYWFTKYTLTWGWATWRRAWRHFDIDLCNLPAWEAFKKSDRFRKYCPDPAEHERWIRQTERSLSEYRAWDAQWMMACWMEGALGIVPAHNLIQNLGFRADAAHTMDDVFGRHRTELRPMKWPLKHPAAVGPDASFDRKTWHAIYRPFSIGEKVLEKILRAKQRLLR